MDPASMLRLSTVINKQNMISRRNDVETPTAFKNIAESFIILNHYEHMITFTKNTTTL
jgi:hypothetical protein